VLCKDDYAKVLIIPFVLLALTSISVTGTIGIRCAIIAEEIIKHTPIETGKLVDAINHTQVANLVFSLATNLVATGIISHKAWKHRQLIRYAMNDKQATTSKVENIMALLWESGVLYCVNGILVLVFTVITVRWGSLRWGTLGDLYTPVSVQFAGIYPTVVLVLVSLQRSLDETSFRDLISSGSSAASTGSVEFAREDTAILNIRRESRASSAPSSYRLSLRRDALEMKVGITSRFPWLNGSIGGVISEHNQV